MCLLITNNYIERKKCLIYRKTDILYEKPGKFCKLYNVHKNIIFKKHMMRRSVGLNNHRSEQLTELVFLKFVNLTNFILKICEYLSTATHSYSAKEAKSSGFFYYKFHQNSESGQICYF